MRVSKHERKRKLTKKIEREVTPKYRFASITYILKRYETRGTAYSNESLKKPRTNG